MMRTKTLSTTRFTVFLLFWLAPAGLALAAVDISCTERAAPIATASADRTLLSYGAFDALRDPARASVDPAPNGIRRRSREASATAAVADGGRLFPLPALRQPAASGDSPRIEGQRRSWGSGRGNLLRRVFADQRYLVTDWWPRELRRTRFTAPLLLAVAGAVGSSGNGVDLRIQREFEHWTSGGRRDVAQALTRLGDVEVGVALLGSSYAIARLSGSRRMAHATSLAAEAMISTGIYSSVLKKLTRRTRPANGGRGSFFYREPNSARQPASFPSGHAMGAFAIATVFTRQYPDRRWVGWLANGTACLIAASRVGLGRHFPSDVFVGALLGRSLGRMVVERDRGSETSRGRFAPWIGPEGGVGVSYGRRW